MRNYLVILILIFTATSCATVQRSNKAYSSPAKKTVSSGSAKSSDPRFINSIEVNQEKQTSVQNHTPAAKYISQENNISAATVDIERANTLQFTYAAKLGTEVESINNLKLFELIDDWWGTQYRMGGTTKDGVDCSAFVQTIMSAVFAVSLPRTSREQYEAARKIPDEELAEGDLVFFNTRGGISHVGVYLANNKFVHASTSGGVMISDLNEAYWKSKYRGAGRIR